MATARETALQSLRDMGYSQGQIDSAMAQVRGQQAKGQTASQIKSNVQNNSSSYFGGSAMYGSGGSSSSSSAGGSTGGSSSNTNAEDIYGDVSGGNKGAGPMDFSGSNGKIDETSLKFGTNAHAEQAKNKNYLTTRNNDIAAYLYGIGSTDSAKVREYLNKFNDFTSAPQEDQDNTVRAISDRLSAIVKEKDTTGMKDMADALNGNTVDNSFIGKAGYYIDGNGKYQKIYGYDEMDDETKGLLDRMDDKQKKYVSNLWAQGMQDDIKYYLDTMRTKDQAAARQKNSQELYDINRESSIIQAEQTLRNAEESYNNLKQNWQYLGNMGMPGTSATKIQAIGDAITEAKTQLNEVKRLTQLSLDAQQKNWDGQVLQYNQQIDNLMYDLKWKVGDEITGALSKYTTAELEGKLDTIDGITAFRKELLDDLDKNLSGLTSASLTQMQWINQQYQDIANKMYEYSQNANTVNPEMSQIKGFYVDGNGNPILNEMGQPIQVPPTAPMEPIFDKETGKLITFATDENGQIVANVQQLWSGGNSEAAITQYGIVSMLEQGYGIGDIIKQFPNANYKDIQSLSEVVKQKYGSDGRSLTWDGRDYNAVSDQVLKDGLNNFIKKYTVTKDGKTYLKKDVIGGQCGAFVNDYLQSMGVTGAANRLFTDPITEKEKNINSYEAKPGSVVIMNSKSKPQYGHVGIVQSVDSEGNMTILQSNKEGEEKVFISKKNINDGDVLGFFDPTKSIQQYNNERQGQASGGVTGGNINEWGYNPTKVGYYDKYLEGKFTTEDTKKYVNPQFENELIGYQRFKDAQASDYAVNILAALYNLEDMSMRDYNNATLGTPRSDGYKYRKYLDTLISNTTLQTLINAKKNNATFGALSDSELDILKNASTILDWKLDRKDFNDKVKTMISDMEQGFIKNGNQALVDKLKAQYQQGKKYNGGEIKYFTNGGETSGVSDTQGSTGGGRQKVGGGNLK